MDPENQQTKNTENLNTQNVVSQQLPNLTQPVSTNPAPNSTAQGDNNSTKIAKNPLQNKRKSTIIVFILVFIISLGTLITSVSTIIKNNKAKIGQLLVVLSLKKTDWSKTLTGALHMRIQLII